MLRCFSSVAECILLIPSDMEEFQRGNTQVWVTEQVCEMLQVKKDSVWVWQSVTMKSLPSQLLLFFLMDLVRESQWVCLGLAWLPLIIIIINQIYIAQFDTNGILTALYIVIKNCLKPVARGFLRVLWFPPLLHRFNDSANKISSSKCDFNSVKRNSWAVPSYQVARNMSLARD